MSSKITVRAYSRAADGHSHSHHQVLLPVRGYIDLTLEGEAATVSYGDCVVIPAGCYHEFRAREDFRFLVIDVDELPSALMLLASPILALDAATHQYVSFMEAQLEHSVTDEMEENMLGLLFELLSRQCHSSKMDVRIKNVVQYMHQDIAKNHSIEELAQVACLSATQFKHLFSKEVQLSPLKYLAKLRMEKARTLLTNTDMPISRIAEEVGFSNPSSFTRSFSGYFAATPKSFRLQN
ncbi:AraC-type DNA-binding domain-containing protein [Vibrio sinaloensis DSM 21326]|uniref:AraC-type DNA-binding domain-containing protein n=1 Tax=Vibrio sinaloensis DSM 21326 TaxID=945550 RepID=E8MD21_PHOS4|nr:AraC family transcriptional regulator [Vibrio sinaloensis]EGA68197.1 AraC-type DNA-binding domain-containing protein [Vibrio sinaloensis DSM 21326]